MKKWLYPAIFTLVLISLLALGFGCSPTQPAPSSSAAAPTSAPVQAVRVKVNCSVNPAVSSWYPIAVTMNDMVSKNSTLDITNSSAAGPLQVIAAVSGAQADLGVHAPGFMEAIALKGVQEFNGKGNPNLRNLLKISDMFMSFMTNPANHITSVAQLKGKKVAWYTASSNSDANSLLVSAGLDPNKDIIKVPLANPNEGTAAVGNGIVDAAMGQIAPATVTLTLQDQIGQIAYLPADPVAYAAAKAKDKNTFLGLSTGTYDPKWFPALKVDKSFVAVYQPIGIITTTSWSDDLAYQYVKTLLNNAPAVAAISPNLQDFSVKTAVSDAFELPYHNGAIKAFKEKGLWSADMDKWQQNALDSLK